MTKWRFENPNVIIGSTGPNGGLNARLCMKLLTLWVKCGQNAHSLVGYA